jgi:hypothetical protein
MVPLLREAGYPRVSTMNQSPEVRTLHTLTGGRCKARVVAMVSTSLPRSQKCAPTISQRCLSFRPTVAGVGAPSTNGAAAPQGTGCFWTWARSVIERSA